MTNFPTHIFTEPDDVDFDTVLRILGRDELFHHTDRNRMHKVAEPTLNWVMREKP